MKKNNSILTIKTKLSPPPARGKDLIVRQQLLELLDQNRDKSLILITASAGYGKSTLMSQWQHSLTLQGVSTAWLTLDDNDNDPSRLFAYLHYVLSGKKERPDAVHIPQRTNNNTAYLASLLSEKTAPMVLFIDELEVLHNPDSIRLLSMLHQHTPAGAQVVVASRQKKSEWSLAKLKLKNQLLELNEHELRFSTQETMRLNALSLTGPINDSFTHILTEKTEGWIAGIRLALLCLPRIDDPQVWVQNITGEIDEITDFLSEEVFRHLGTEQQLFLLKVSVLNRMSSSLCESLTGEAGAQIQLESFCKKGLFLQPLDEQRHWFRLHGLFRQFLLKRLAQLTPQNIPTLHNTAAAWYNDHGYKLEAVQHAITANNLSFAADILESVSKHLVTQGQLTTLVSLSSKISSQYPINTPTLLSTTCWAYLFLQKQNNAEELLERLRTVKEKNGLPEDLLSLYFTLESLLLVMKDDVTSAGVLAQQKLPYIRESDHFERGVLTNIISLYKLGTHDYSLAQQYILKARAAHIKSKSCFGLAYSDTLLGIKEYQLGNLLQAKELFNNIGSDPEYQNFNDSALTKQVSKGVCIGFHAGLLYELNLLDEAQQLLDNHFTDAINNTIPPDMVIIGCLARARIAFSKGDLKVSYAYLEEGEIVGVSSSLPRLITEMRWERVHFAIRLGDLNSARTFAMQTDVNNMPSYPVGFFNPADVCGSKDIAYLRYDIHTGNTNTSLKKIATLLPEAKHIPVRALTLTVLRAIAYTLQEDAVNAYESMLEAIDLALKTGSIRRIIDEGPHAIKLLNELYLKLSKSSNIIHKKRIAYCISLLELTNEFKPINVGNTALMEDLSERELEILRLVEGGLKNDQIAEEIFLSVNTVKWHLRRLYQKLSANSRTEAISKGRQLGLID